MSTQENRTERIGILQGTLDLLILRTLVFGKQHGQGIARAIQESSDDVLLVDHGSLYPALYRMEKRGWLKASWGVSENNRRAKFYKITRSGQKRLASERANWTSFSSAVEKILGA